MSPISNPVNLTIDGRHVTVERGGTIMQAAEALGIFVPHFCFHKDLSWSGACRQCFVEVEKTPKLVTSCCTPAAEGMAVHTDSPAVREGRRSVLEFLLLNHPIDCPVCDQSGECSLQDYYMQFGLYDTKMALEDKAHHAKAMRLGDMIVLDRERCVLCVRCVRFCAEISGSHALRVHERGGDTEIASFQDQPIVDAYSGCLADVCPVGALTNAKFRFKCRVWFLESADSVCASCSTGCNIRIDANNNVIYRFVPRRNPEVNASWICDEGRMGFEALQSPQRLSTPQRRLKTAMTPVSWDEALNAVAAAVRAASPDAVAGVAAAGAANEDLFMFRALLRDVIGSPHLDYRADTSHTLTREMEDHLLRRKDKYPNSTGAADMDILPGPGGLDAAGIFAAAAKGKIQALLLLQDDPAARGAELRDALRRVPHVILLTTHAANATFDAAEIALPLAAYTERDGTFTNYARRVQRIRRAVAAPGQARPAWQILRDIAERLGRGLPAATAEDVFAMITRAVPAYAGLTYPQLDPGGIKLERR